MKAIQYEMHSDYEHVKELKDFLELFGCTWKTYSCDYLYCHGKKYMSPAHPMTISWVTFTVVWFNSFLLISIIIYFISKIELYGTITRRELK